LAFVFRRFIQSRTKGRQPTGAFPHLDDSRRP
jgi:hypothetical protein